MPRDTRLDHSNIVAMASKVWVSPSNIECAIIHETLEFVGNYINGYVRLPEPIASVYENYEDEDLLNVDVHGGLSYGPDMDGWIGFDTMHYQDIKNPWSEQEAIDETNRLAEQIANLAAEYRRDGEMARLTPRKPKRGEA